MSMDMEPSREYSPDKEMRRRLFIVSRNRDGPAFPRGKESNFVRLREFGAWAISISWDVPPAFRAWINAVAKSEPPESPIDPRERDSLLKLVLGLAIGGYSYDPKAKRNDVMKDIEKDLKDHGLVLSDDTIRKFLDEARQTVMDRGRPDQATK